MSTAYTALFTCVAYASRGNNNRKNYEVTRFAHETRSSAIAEMPARRSICQLKCWPTVVRLVSTFQSSWFCRRDAWHVCSAFKTQLQGLYYSSDHYPLEKHFSNVTGCLSNGEYSSSWIPLPTKSYTLVLHHIGLNAFIPYVSFRTLRSSSSTNLYVSRTNLHFGSSSFHIAAPSTLHSS